MEHFYIKPLSGKESSLPSGVACCLFLLHCALSMTDAKAQQGNVPSEVVLSRYTTSAAMPDANEADPLAAIVRIQFPRREINTVGDAIRYALIRTGYILLEPQDSSAVAAVMARPLPESQRVLGTYSVESMLGVLMGKPFALHIDPLHRSVSYSSPKAAPSFQANAAEQPGVQK